MEKVQRQATRFLDGFTDVSYEDRLEQTGLISLGA
jgi:hypothetical protein